MFTNRLKKLSRFSFFNWILICIGLYAHPAMAGDLKLVWDASPSANVGGYIISYGTATKSYTENIDVGNNTAYTVVGLQDGATYYFAVKTYNAAKTLQSVYSNEISAVISAATGLTASITASKASGAAPLMVNFTGAVTPSTTAVTSWGWAIKNGATAVATASGQNYTYQFNTAGTYTVSLTATGSGGTAGASKTITVNPPAATTPVADFTASVVNGASPLTVNFNDASTGTIASRTWDFGDGSSSSAANPSHVFINNTSAAISYNIQLTVTGSGGTDMVAKTITVAPGAGTGVSSLASQNLVAAYRFDEAGGSIALDASGHNNHGVVSGVAPVAGKFGNGLKFNGVDSWVTVNDSASLDLTTGMTLEAWVKSDAIQTSTILTKEKINGRAFGMNLYDDADLPSSIINDGAAQRVVSGTKQLPVNTWVHLASTYDGSYQRLYVNGQLVKARAQTGNIKVSTGKLRIGGNSVAAEYFNGIIDEVKIYNRALSATEILSDFGSEIAKTNPTQLLAGNSVLEPAVDSNPQGLAEAFRVTATKTGYAVNMKVYVEAGSSVTDLAVGVYTDNNGHPGSLLAKGQLSWPAFGATNTVPMPAVKFTAGTNYWLAILGAKGVVKVRSHGNNTDATPTETSKSSALTSLPNVWATGAVGHNGPLSVYAGGY